MADAALAASAARDYDHEHRRETSQNSLIWKARHNSAALVCQLPPELLCHIFQLACRDWNRDIKRYIRCSHVCKHWRTVALNCKTLWNHLDDCFAKPANLAQEMLRRSKDAPLIVECKGGTGVTFSGIRGQVGYYEGPTTRYQKTARLVETKDIQQYTKILPVKKVER